MGGIVVKLRTYQIATRQRDQMVEVTDMVREAVRASGVQEGYAIVYCPHTTAGIAINENADPDVVRDVLRRLDEIYPWEHSKDRHAEGNTAAHMKAIQTGTSQTFLIQGGRMLLGTWQGIYFCEFDGPRSRTFYVKTVEG